MIVYLAAWSTACVVALAIAARTWWSNLIVSSGLYGLGGAMWSLRGQRGARPSFAFVRDDWPASLADGNTAPLLPYIAIFMIAVVGILSPFLIEAIR